MKKLIGMTDYVLDIDSKEHWALDFTRCVNHANFLKQQLEKWMFVPCDEEGNVLEEPNRSTHTDLECEIYQQAKERVIFEGFVKCNRNSNVNCVYSEDLDLHLDTDFKFAKTIEDLVKYNLTLRK